MMEKWTKGENEEGRREEEGRDRGRQDGWEMGRKGVKGGDGRGNEEEEKAGKERKGENRMGVSPASVARARTFQSK